jgi:hypothetical protein
MKRKPPTWCTKPSPCDRDEQSCYCPHRECRAELEAQLARCRQALEEAPRLGWKVDDPEGARYIQISDTLARKLCDGA